jgi:Mg2+/citrate symporter
MATAMMIVAICVVIRSQLTGLVAFIVIVEVASLVQRVGVKLGKKSTPAVGLSL